MPINRSREAGFSRPRPRRGLVRRALGMLWRHPVLAGAALASVGWLLGGDRRTRTRRLADDSIPVSEAPFNSRPAEGAPNHG